MIGLLRIESRMTSRQNKYELAMPRLLRTVLLVILIPAETLASSPVQENRIAPKDLTAGRVRPKAPRQGTPSEKARIPVPLDTHSRRNSCQYRKTG
ncbi:hypothetical protein DFS34DRAFT_376586 [Phlyctochytrium arcticum]|nr:hypothetical protein DFS34DRAFT_376586 [Phlyctochytrium arcticum]